MRSNFTTLGTVGLLALTLAACAGPDGGPGTENRTETIATGGILGAVTGAVIGAVTGGGRSAAIGAAGGAALGAGAGYFVARNNEQAAANEQQLRSRSTAAQREAGAYAQRSRATQREIAALRRDVETVRAQYRQGLISAGEYNARIAPLSRQADQLAQRAAQEQATIQRYQADAATGRRNGWNTAELDRAVQSMSADNQRERTALDEVQRSLNGRG